MIMHGDFYLRKSNYVKTSLCWIQYREEYENVRRTQKVPALVLSRVSLVTKDTIRRYIMIIENMAMKTRS
ncbi:MAG: hypothetical protein EZS28_005177 [Streblomastix strix]|uniref:Uncharacterized protein n=1 Tax=Streblomastix strix TaxID=222440 RepID=A0A5J4WXK4_9EUKA|nr:MAG: hypothetical protein EZS28_005177 [Streblomastix strix]